MNLTPVDSSNVKAIGFDSITQDLIVQYHHNNECYAYHNVPQEIFEGLKVAESIGKFLNTNIKKIYTFTKLTQEAT